jgi:hypothetical protein
LRFPGHAPRPGVTMVSIAWRVRSRARQGDRNPAGGVLSTCPQGPGSRCGHRRDAAPAAARSGTRPPW